MASDPSIEKQVPFARGVYMKLKATGKIVEVFDTYFAWRQRHGIGGIFPTVQIEIMKGAGVQLATDVNYECTITVKEVAARVDIPFGPFAIPSPAWSKKHATLKVQELNDEELTVRFEGDTYSFRSNFMALGVPGRYETANGDPLPADASMDEKKKSSYVRIIKTWDVSGAEKNNFLLDMINKSVYENTLVKLEWYGNGAEGSAVAAFKDKLKKLENVVFGAA